MILIKRKKYDMKKWLKITGLFAFLAIFLTGCSMDDDSGYNFYLGYATTQKTETGRYDLILDNGTVMEVTIPMSPYPEGFEFRDNQRVYANFSILDERTEEGTLYYRIQLNNIMEILSKKPVYSSRLGESEQQMGNDPIDLTEKWFSGNYLNVIFEIGVNKEEIIHFINLLVDEDHEGADEDNIYVEVRHNANGDLTARTADGVVSFDVREFLPEGKTSVTVHISYEMYNGKKITESKVYARDKVDVNNSTLSAVQRFNIQ